MDFAGFETGRSQNTVSVGFLREASDMAGFISHLSFPFPQIESFCFEVGAVSPANSPIIWTPVVVSGQPRLRRLKLHGVFIPFDIPVYCGLRHLNLSWVACADLATIPSITALLDILALCPGLKTFNMFNWRSVLLPDTQYGPDFMVELPYLQELGLGFNPRNIANILAHLSLPPTATIRIRCVFIEIVDDFDLFLLEGLYPHSPARFQVLSRIESLDVTTSWEDDEISFRVHALDSTDNKLLDLVIKFSNMGDEAAFWIEHAVPAISALVNLTGRACSSSTNLWKVVVSQDFKPEISAQDWYSLLNPIPTVTHLEFHTSSTYPREFRRDDSIIEALSPSTLDGLLCPSLHVLQLSPVHVDPSWVELFKTCLHCRADIGGGSMDEIVIEGLVESDVQEAFREVAKDIVVCDTKFTYSLQAV